jgi:beta-lactamase superfamily II metal-dependent hydrolase
MNKLQRYLLSIVFLFVLSITPTFAADLQVHFIDVGQGDSILVISPDGKKLLIDAGIHPGKDDKWNPFNYIRALKETGKIDNLNIDNAIITHPHDDHYKGFSYLCGKDKDRNDFSITNLYYSVDAQTSYGRFWDCLQSISKKSKSYGQISARGPPIDLGSDVKLTILYPFQPVDTPSIDKNEDSVVLRIEYKKVSFLMTGDAPSKVERQLLDKEIRSNVLKPGHHGSKTSSSKGFLGKVQPASEFQMVISANCQDGKGKRYGHPDKEVLKKIKDLGEVSLYRTDLHGTVVFTTDGETISVKTEQDEISEEKLWEPGEKS